MEVNYTTESVGARHQRRMQGWSYAPDGVVADDAGQSKGRHHGSKCGVRRHNSESQKRSDASGVRQAALHGFGERIRRNDFNLWLCSGSGLLRLGRHGDDGWRPCDGSVLRDDASAHHVVLQVDVEVIFLADRQQELRNVVGVERRGLRWKTGRQIGVADVNDVMDGRDLAWNNRCDVSSRLGGEIDDDGSGFHGLDVLLQDQNRRFAARNQSGGDDDVDLLALLREQSHLGIDELLAHLLRVPAGSRTFFLDVNGQKLRAHRLDLLLRG